MGQIHARLSRLSVGRNSLSVLMKLHTIVWKPEGKIDFLSVVFTSDLAIEMHHGGEKLGKIGEGMVGFDP